MIVIIFTDGASRGNPGKASYGFSITDENKKLIYEEGKYLGIQTNNFAEYSAVLAALLYVQSNLTQVTEIKFFMDSLLAAKQLSGKYKIKSQNLMPLIFKIKDIESKFKVTYSHVPRAQNKIADALANLALDSLK